MKDDEKALLVEVYINAEFYERLSADTIALFDPWVATRPRGIVSRMDIAEKRALYIFEKWTMSGIYDYGTSTDVGWLTEKGRELAKSLMI